VDQDQQHSAADRSAAAPEEAAAEAAIDAFDSGARAYLADDNAAAIEQLSWAATSGGLPEAYYLLGLAQLRAGNPEAGADALRQAAAATGNVMLRDYAQRKLARLGKKEA
jgi:hypothetical protein